MEVTFFRKPNGEKSIIDMRNIAPDDEKYLNDNFIKVSMEEGIDGNPILYFDAGRFLDDNETPDEIIIFAHSRSCEEVMAEAVRRIKQLQD